MEALLVSMLVIALGELGDKTQLLSFSLAARFQRPLPIILGIFVATLTNQLLAGLVSALVRGAISPEILRVVQGVSFLALPPGRSCQTRWTSAARRQGSLACFR